MKTKISDVRIRSNVFAIMGKRWCVSWRTNRSKYSVCLRYFNTRREAREFKRKKMIQAGLLIVLPEVKTYNPPMKHWITGSPRALGYKW